MGLFSGKDITYYSYGAQGLLVPGQINNNTKLIVKQAILEDAQDIAMEYYKAKNTYRVNFDVKKMTEIGVAPVLTTYLTTIEPEVIKAYMQDNYPLDDTDYDVVSARTGYVRPEDEYLVELFNDSNYNTDTNEYSYDGKLYKLVNTTSVLNDPVEVTMEDEIAEWSLTNTDGATVEKEITTIDRTATYQTNDMTGYFVEDRHTTMKRDLVDNYEYDEDEATVVIDGDTHTDVELTDTDTDEGEYITTCKDADDNTVEIHTTKEDYTLTIEGTIPVIWDSGDILGEYLDPIQEDYFVGDGLYPGIRFRALFGDTKPHTRYYTDVLGEAKYKTQYTTVLYTDTDGNKGIKLLHSKETEGLYGKAVVKEALTPIVNLKYKGQLMEEGSPKWEYLTKLNIDPTSLVEQLNAGEIKNAILHVGINPLTVPSKDADNYKDRQQHKAIARALFDMFDMYRYETVLDEAFVYAWRMYAQEPNVEVDLLNTKIKYTFHGSKEVVEGTIDNQYEFDVEDYYESTADTGADGPYTGEFARYDGSVSSTVSYIEDQKLYYEAKRLVLRKRNTNNTVTVITISNLTQIMQIESDFVSGLIKNNGQLRLLLPLSVLKKLPYTDWSYTYEHSIALGVESSQTVHVKWYQTGFMKMLTVIVGSILIVVGTITGQAWMINVGVGMVVGTATSIALDALGVTNPIVRAIVQIMVAKYTPQAGTTTTNTPITMTVSDIVSIVSAINMYKIQEQAEEIERDTEAFLLERKARDEEAQEFMDKLVAMDNPTVDMIVDIIAADKEGQVVANQYKDAMNPSEFKFMFCNGLGGMAIDSYLLPKGVTVAPNKSVASVPITNTKELGRANLYNIV